MEFSARDPGPQFPPRSPDLLHEPLLRGLLEHASTMITVKGVHGRFLLVNPAFARAFGREPADLVGLSTRDVVPRSLAAAWSAHDHQVITSGVALQAPERFPGEQGKLGDCIATEFPLFGEDGTVVAIGSLRVEIGDLEAARDALEDSERRFQALFEQSAVGQIECDLRGRLTALNRTAAALLGLPAAPATLRTSVADVLTVPPVTTCTRSCAAS